jgi:hypothetical protein
VRWRLAPFTPSKHATTTNDDATAAGSRRKTLHSYHHTPSAVRRPHVSPPWCSFTTGPKNPEGDNASVAARSMEHREHFCQGSTLLLFFPSAHLHGGNQALLPSVCAPRCVVWLADTQIVLLPRRLGAGPPRGAGAARSLMEARSFGTCPRPHGWTSPHWPPPPPCGGHMCFTTGNCLWVSGQAHRGTSSGWGWGHTGHGSRNHPAPCHVTPATVHWAWGVTRAVVRARGILWMRLCAVVADDAAAPLAWHQCSLPAGDPSVATLRAAVAATVGWAPQLRLTPWYPEAGEGGRDSLPNPSASLSSLGFVPGAVVHAYQAKAEEAPAMAGAGGAAGGGSLPAPPPPGFWECGACTLFNALAATVCEVCASPRPRCVGPAIAGCCGPFSRIVPRTAGPCAKSALVHPVTVGSAGSRRSPPPRRHRPVSALCTPGPGLWGRSPTCSLGSTAAPRATPQSLTLRSTAAVSAPPAIWFTPSDPHRCVCVLPWLRVAGLSVPSMPCFARGFTPPPSHALRRSKLTQPFLRHVPI